MEEYILPMIVGLLIVVMGMINLKGNISTLHWYHRQRVSEADRLPFGRLVGTGTILIGAALILFGMLSYAADYLQNPMYETVGTVIMIVSFVGMMLINIFSWNFSSISMMLLAAFVSLTCFLVRDSKQEGNVK